MPCSRQSSTLIISILNPRYQINRNLSRLNHIACLSITLKSSMSSSPSIPSNSPMPAMIYGTAWKKERTADLVYQAIKSGFRAIDTASMKRHYDEALTGEGIRRAINEGIVTRKDLWIQTKYTPQDPDFLSLGSISAQINASVTSSLFNLSVSEEEEEQPPYLDALILHSPYPTISQTLEAWQALKPFVESKQIRYLGISNTPFSVLQALYNSSDVKPYVVQNRFRAAEYSWDFKTRKFCKENGIKYQGFWTLTGNPDVWQRKEFVRDVAEGSGVGLAEAWYCLMRDGGSTEIVVLNGTTNEERMKGDLDAVGKVKAWRESDGGKQVWERSVKEFRELVDGE
ncbi:NADP-dependent oxidoreductase domain-containing protein [Cladorrhinum sp. PSN259]|nr:NADP-dependent oxidoreductase domain-containing protein [Cladorrhinum sp. PSN259]